MPRMHRPLLLAPLALALACADPAGVTRLEVPPGGGTLVSADGLFTLIIPEGALAEETEVSITERDDLLAAGLSSRIYEVSPLELVLGRDVSVRYRAPRSTWVGQRTIATFDDGVAEAARDGWRDYDHRSHVASAVYRTLERRMFGLATLIEPNEFDPCSVGCSQRYPGCVVDPDALPAGCSVVDGWSDPPNTGLTFVINSIFLADTQRGFDVDGRCRAPGECTDNMLGTLGQLLNDQIRQSILGGEIMTLVELSGLDHPGDATADASTTVKLYEARDFDDPFFPANNFSNPAGETRCCEFFIDGDALTGAQPNARARIATRIDGGTVTTREPAEVGLWASLPVPGVFGYAAEEREVPYPRSALRDAQISFRVDTDAHGQAVGLTDGLLGGVLAVRDLALAPNPYCVTLNNLCRQPQLDDRMFDFILHMVGRPDVDRDGDGLETFRVGPDGRIAECLDGDGSLVPAVDPARPESCAEHERVGDGYSVAYGFSAVAAKVKGVRATP